MVDLLGAAALLRLGPPRRITCASRLGRIATAIMSDFSELAPDLIARREPFLPLMEDVRNIHTEQTAVVPVRPVFLRPGVSPQRGAGILRLIPFDVRTMWGLATAMCLAAFRPSVWPRFPLPIIPASTHVDGTLGGTDLSVSFQLLQRADTCCG